MNVGIVIPTVGAGDVDAVIQTCPEGRAYVVDNRETNWSVAAAWNYGITQALADGCTDVLVVNDDVRLHPGCAEALLAALNTRACLIAGAVPDDRRGDVSWAVFVCDHRLFSSVGRFDERYWPAYYEDVDMEAQLAQAGHAIKRVDSAQFTHERSLSRRTLAGLQAVVDAGNIKNRAYFREKWGWDPG